MGKILHVSCIRISCRSHAFASDSEHKVCATAVGVIPTLAATSTESSDATRLAHARTMPHGDRDAGQLTHDALRAQCGRD